MLEEQLQAYFASSKTAAARERKKLETNGTNGDGVSNGNNAIIFRESSNNV